MTTPPDPSRSLLDIDACELPQVERPLRVDEFESLFAETLVGVERRGSQSMRLVLEGEANVRRRAQDLADRESACCSFFTFSITETPHRVFMDVEVPADRTSILDGLFAMATSRLAVRDVAASRQD